MEMHKASSKTCVYVVPPTGVSLARLCAQFICSKVYELLQTIDEKKYEWYEECMVMESPSVSKLRNCKEVCHMAANVFKEQLELMTSAEPDVPDEKDEKDEKDAKKDKEEKDEVKNPKDAWYDDLIERYDYVGKLYEFFFVRRLYGIITDANLVLDGESRRKLKEAVEKPKFRHEFGEMVVRCMRYSLYSACKAIDALILGQPHNGYEECIEHICHEYLEASADMWAYQSGFRAFKDKFTPKFALNWMDQVADAPPKTSEERLQASIKASSKRELADDGDKDEKVASRSAKDRPSKYDYVHKIREQIKKYLPAKSDSASEPYTSDDESSIHSYERKRRRGR